jgi:hypothetical protein
MNTAYITSSRIVNLDSFVDATWIDSPNATLRVSFAAPGFSRLVTADVVEPYASRVWEKIQPADGVDVAEAAPAPPPAPEPTRNGSGHANGVPAWARQEAAKDKDAARRVANGEPARKYGHRPRPDDYDAPPTNGRQLFAWAKRITERGDVDLVKFLVSLAKREGLPTRIAEWDRPAVDQAVIDATEFLNQEANA